VRFLKLSIEYQISEAWGSSLTEGSESSADARDHG
jgi:hypothetical protein